MKSTPFIEGNYFKERMKISIKIVVTREERGWWKDWMGNWPPMRKKVRNDLPVPQFQPPVQFMKESVSTSKTRTTRSGREHCCGCGGGSVASEINSQWRNKTQQTRCHKSEVVKGLNIIGCVPIILQPSMYTTLWFFPLLLVFLLQSNLPNSIINHCNLL